MTEPRVSDHPIHPWYGPCDGFGLGHNCSECLRVVEHTRAENAALRSQVNALLRVVADCSQELAPLLDSAANPRRSRIYDDAMKLLASTPEQSLADVKREVIERCARVCDSMSGWRDWAALNDPAFPGAPCEAGAAADWLAAAIRALAEGKGM